MMKQSEVDTAFMETKREWQRMVSASGKTEAVYIATSNEAASFLIQFHEIQQAVRAQGLKIPELVDGLTIKEVEK